MKEKKKKKVRKAGCWRYPSVSTWGWNHCPSWMVYAVCHKRAWRAIKRTIYSSRLEGVVCFSYCYALSHEPKKAKSELQMLCPDFWTYNFLVATDSDLNRLKYHIDKTKMIFVAL
jgi:hypothetical protein